MKIKKLFFVCWLLVMVACSPAPQEPLPQQGQDEQVSQNGEVQQDEQDQQVEETGNGIEIALVVSHGGINDGSFNQGSWEGMVAFANSHNVSAAHFTPAEFTDAGYIAAIELAVQAGANIVLTPGFTFAHAIYSAQDIFPGVYFAIFDELPSNPQTWEPRIEQNTVAVTYAEEQAGFLAGFAVVMEGHRQLGFIGGMPMPPVVRFGHGFVLGAEYAATTLGLDPGAVTIMYHYAMTFEPAPEVQTLAAAWFNAGTEVIFAAAGGAGAAVMAAAEAQDGLVVGVDSDQANDSPTVITSALKGVAVSVYNILVDYFEGQFPGGTVLTFGADTYGVGLSMETSRFENFTNEQYLEIFDRITEIPIAVSVDQAAGDIPLIYVTVIVV
ncbi:MAG: BMP family ABC transporter substrate-binding protein [Defluviitaleaceae bacterium]|nr:BMP family ABC transporter substrate-binding protein [Defluviitaleaceae bacterium]